MNDGKDIVDIYPIIYRASYLKRIHNTLLGDLNLPVYGESIIKKQTGRGNYAHVKIRISQLEESYNHQCIWLVSDSEIPGDYRKNVRKALSFFIAYFDSIPGIYEFKFRFEILDASFHPVDSNGWDFEHVTLQAIVNAFDKSFLPPDLSTIYRYKNRK